jgi:hypothetical protein
MLSKQDAYRVMVALELYQGRFGDYPEKQGTTWSPSRVPTNCSRRRVHRCTGLSDWLSSIRKVSSGAVVTKLKPFLVLEQLVCGDNKHKKECSSS